MGVLTLHNTALFKGLDLRERCPDGAFRSLTNISTKNYPAFTAVAPCADFSTPVVGSPSAMIRKTFYYDVYGDTVDCLCVPLGSMMRYYYLDGDYLRTFNTTAGSLTGVPKQMVSMGARLVIFPDKKFIDSYSPTEIKSLGASAANPIPDLDYICECGNRIWGCRFSVDPVNGEVINELYACALGDPTKWNQYEGLSTDSWTASCGSDGRWTGAICYNGYPTFFKERSITRIYPSATGAHKVVEYPVPGVADMSADSLAIVNGVLYYLGTDGVYAWDGGQPVKVSAALGNRRYAIGKAGTAGGKYYLCAAPQPGGQGYENLVYDTETGLWSASDKSRVLCSAEMDGKLFFIYVAPTGYRLACREAVANAAALEAFPWAMESGPIYYGSLAGVNNAYKYPPAHLWVGGKFLFHVDAPAATTFTLSLKYDGDENWTDVGTFTANADGIVEFPVTPRRCGSFRWKLSGTGEMILREVSFEEGEGSERL